MKKQQFVLNDHLLESSKQRLEVEDAFGEAASCLICSICAADAASAAAVGFTQCTATGAFE